MEEQSENTSLTDETIEKNLISEVDDSNKDDLESSKEDKSTTCDPVKNDKKSKTVTSMVVKKLKSDEETKPKRGQEPYHKIVIRRLPPTMTAETFLEQVSPLPEYNYFHFVKGDNNYGPNSFARGYINFVNSQDVFDFKDKFDNYVFLDTKGNEYFAVVEFACFQRIPKKRLARKKDNKCGSIESDPMYIRFLEEFNNSENVDGNPKPEYSFQIKDDKKRNDFVSTPLIEYLNNRKQEQNRIREERREERRKRDASRRRMKEEERRRKRNNINIGKSSLSNLKEQFKEFSKELGAETDENKLENKDLSDSKDIENTTVKTESKDGGSASTVSSHSSSKTMSNSSKPVHKKYESYYRSGNSKTFVMESTCKPRFPHTERGRKDIYARDSESSSNRSYDSFHSRHDSRSMYENKFARSRKSLDSKYSNSSTLPSWKQREHTNRETKHREKEQDKDLPKEKTRSVDEKSKEEKNYEKDKKSSEKTEKEDVKGDTSDKNEKSSEKNSENGKNGEEKEKDDPRTQRRIRNKDRPAIQIYRPGMGRFSKERKSQEVESKSNSDC